MKLPLSVQNFVDNTKKFIAWAENSEEKYTASVALRHISSLYMSALQLPRHQSQEPTEEEPDALEFQLSAKVLERIYQRASNLPFQYYGVVFNSLEIPPEEAVIGDIADDIRDIYADVIEGLFLFEHNRVEKPAGIGDICLEFIGGNMQLEQYKHCTISSQKKIGRDYDFLRLDIIPVMIRWETILST